MSFLYPYVLVLLILPVIWLVWLWRDLSHLSGLSYSYTGLLRRYQTPYAALYLMAPPILRSLLFVSLIVAAARPVVYDSHAKKQSEGLDIVLALDTSQSMLAMDFEWQGKRQNRLQVVKNVVQEFIGMRPDDRIGLVVFGTEAYTQAPLTLDHKVLQQFLRLIDIGMAGPDTAIGDGLGTAIKRIKEVEAPSKIVILLSDGTNTAGQIDPGQAAELAKTLGIRVYTIAVGTNEPVPFPYRGFFGLEYRMQEIKTDVELLKAIAEKTGAQFFQAKDTEGLRDVYATIDKLEKRSIEWEQPRVSREMAWVPLCLALLFLLLEALWALSPWRVIP